MILIIVCLFLVLTVCAYTDLAYHKVCNWATIPAIFAGLGLRFIFQGMEGLRNSLVGLAIGFGFFFLMFMIGGLGAGDVKLMGAVGALGGWPFVLWAIFYTALIGGVMGLSVLIWHGDLGKSLRRSFRYMLGRPRAETIVIEKKTVRYGLAIVLGTYCAWFLKGF